MKSLLALLSSCTSFFKLSLSRVAEVLEAIVVKVVEVVTCFGIEGMIEVLAVEGMFEILALLGLVGGLLVVGKLPVETHLLLLLQ